VLRLKYQHSNVRKVNIWNVLLSWLVHVAPSGPPLIPSCPILDDMDIAMIIINLHPRTQGLLFRLQAQGAFADGFGDKIGGRLN